MLSNNLIHIYELLNKDKPNIIRGAMNADFVEVEAALKENPDCITEADEKTGLTALHIAVGEWNYKMVDLLCNQPGYDITLQDGWGRCPLSMASTIGGNDIRERLMRDTNNKIARNEKLASAKNVTILRPKNFSGP